MLLMLGILTLIYFMALFLISVYRFNINAKICDAVFIVADLVFFFCWTYGGYLEGWLKDGWLTLDNISPFIFTIIPLLVFVKDKYKQFAYCAIAFLNVGMFFALLISPEHAYIFNFDTEASFIYTAEAACHLLASLYGIYLVLTGRVTVSFKSWLKSIAFMFSVITLGVILNFIFHKSFFGMDPYGHASIYMFDFFDSFFATLTAYYFSVLVVLTVGMQSAYLVEKATAKLAVHKKENEDVENSESDSEDFLLV
jgi:hypothetical protein